MPKKLQHPKRGYWHGGLPLQVTVGRGEKRDIGVFENIEPLLEWLDEHGIKLAQTPTPTLRPKAERAVAPTAVRPMLRDLKLRQT